MTNETYRLTGILKGSSRAEAAFRRRRQNRTTLPFPVSVIQKFTPSLQAPNGLFTKKNVPIELRSVACHIETLSAFVTRMRSPSNAAELGEFKPLPLSVARSAPFEARTTVTVLLPMLGTQMFVPSKVGNWGLLPTITVWMTK